MEGKVVVVTSLVWVLLVVIEFCVSAQRKDFVSGRQNDDLPLKGKLSRRDDLYLQTSIVQGICPHLMGTLSVSKLELLEDIQKNIWFIDSSGAFTFSTTCISMYSSLTEVILERHTKLVTICHRKCFIFGGRHTF